MINLVWFLYRNNSLQLIIHCQDDHSDEELPDERSLRQQCWRHSVVQGVQTSLTEKEIGYTYFSKCQVFGSILQFLAGFPFFMQI